MKTLSLFLGLFLLFFTSCSNQLAALRGEKNYHDLALDELRIEVADIKHTLHTQQMEMSLLEDKIREKDQALSSLTREMSGKKSLKTEQLFEEIVSLQKKLSYVEKMQEKVAGDIKQLNNHANQTASTFSQYRDKIYEMQKELDTVSHKINDVAKLKSTLSNLSKTLNTKSSSSVITYKVKSGDSLGKIANDHRISVEALKKYNDLDNDRIYVGKELKIPYGE